MPKQVTLPRVTSLAVADPTQVTPPPAAMAEGLVTAGTTLATCGVGAKNGVVDPAFPSWPSRPRPQHCTSPALVMPQLCSGPALSARNGVVETTRGAVTLGPLVPAWPRWVEPQQ